MDSSKGINKVAVVGAGLMGFGIGVDFARAGYETWLFNTKDETSKEAKKRARDALNRFIETEMMTIDEAEAAYERLHPSTSLEETAEGADYVAESVLENLSLKREIFAKLDRLCPPESILTSNASTFTITSIVSENHIKHPDRCCIAHYFQPAHLLPLVEVVGGVHTSSETLERVMELLTLIRKKPVLIPVEMPGHVANRLQGAISREINRLMKKNVCTPEMIDEIIMHSFGRRMAYTGWFIRSDLVGLDSSYNAAKGAGREVMRPVQDRVARGDLGMKTGRGFYEWPDYGEAVKRKQDLELIRYLKQDLEENKI